MTFILFYELLVKERMPVIRKNRIMITYICQLLRRNIIIGFFKYKNLFN